MIEVMTPAEVAKKLRGCNITQVAEEVGISYTTVYNLSVGDTNPTYRTLVKMTNYLVKKEKVK